MALATSIYNKVLIIRADGTARVVSRDRTHRLRNDEFAFRLTVKIPPAWGRIIGDLEVALPDEPATVTVEEDEEAREKES